MGGDGIATGGRQQRQDTCLTATPSAARRTLPPLHSVTSCLLELYQECVENSGWARELYGAHGGMQRLSFFKIPSAAPVTAPPPPSTCQPGPWSVRRGVPARGDNHVTGGGERPGLRGGVPARSPAPPLSYCRGKPSHGPCYPHFSSSLCWRCCGPPSGCAGYSQSCQATLHCSAISTSTA